MLNNSKQEHLNGVHSAHAHLRALSGLIVLMAVFFMAGTPLADSAQIRLAIITILTLFLAGKIAPSSGVLRILILLLTIFTSSRYIIWRATETLPESGFLEITLGLMLFGAECYGFCILLMSTFIASETKERAPRPAPLAASACPSVDIIIPTYNETSDLLRVTLTAALKVSYPKGRARVYLLDDGGTDAKCNQLDPEKAQIAKDRKAELQALCENFGATYLTREKNDHAKAGNINAALPRLNGELLLTLDADHVPASDILWRTVGHFVDDPGLFLVQTPHFFVNPDPLERNLNMFDHMPSENEMFYSVVQLGLDGLNASFFCGSAAVLRRSCLLEIGGIQTDTITEDAETALELHARGYRSAFISQPMVAGLSPETFSGFIIQRMRWTQGMVQIFLLKNPLFKPGLTIAQRIGYMNSCFFWFFPLARLAFILGPLFYLIFGIEIYKGSLDDFLMYGAPHIIGALFVSATLFGDTRWAITSELYEVIQAIHCSGAIFKVFMNPHTPTFAVTPKAESAKRSFISPLAGPFYWLIALVLLGQVLGAFRLTQGAGDYGIVMVLLAWNTFHLILLFAALGILFEKKQTQAVPRVRIQSEITLETKEGLTLQTQMQDISVKGMGLTISPVLGTLLSIGDEVELDISDLGARTSRSLTATVQANTKTDAHTKIGLQFQIENREEWELIVSLVYAQSQNWAKFRERRTGRGQILQRITDLLGRSFARASAHIGILFRKQHS